MYRYTVRVPAHAQRISLGAYVRRAFPLLPESVLRAAFAERDVKMDGRRCAKETAVVPGSEVTVFTPCEAAMAVVYEDEHILAVDKPAGVSCDADAYGSMTVADWAAIHAGGAYTPRMVHRLDNRTSGLLLLAKDEAAEEALKRMFARHTGVKQYACIVGGRPEPPEAVREAWLTKDASGARVRVSEQERSGAKKIVTGYETLRSGLLSLLRVTLFTGRTHQIRAHMAFLGHPVLGDDRYGDRALNRSYRCDQLMLRSVSLRVDTEGEVPEIDGKLIEIPLKLDESFDKLY